jgi:hypothetical protein
MAEKHAYEEAPAAVEPGREGRTVVRTDDTRRGRLDFITHLLGQAPDDLGRHSIPTPC